MDLAAPLHVPNGITAYAVSHGDDRKLFVEFDSEPVHQVAESNAAGRPIFKDVPHIRIRFPGDNTREIYRPVKLDPDQSRPFPPDPERFPRQWAAFQAQEHQAQDGSPIEEWAAVSRSQARELKAVNIHTVEQLAGVIDSALQGLGMGGRDLRAKAQAWLAQAADAAAGAALATENVRLRNEMDAMKAQIAELAAAQGGKAKAKEKSNAEG